MTDADTPALISLPRARELNASLFLEAAAAFRGWLEGLRVASAEATADAALSLDELIRVGEAAFDLGTAVFSTRYGVGQKLATFGFTGYDCLYYHNTQHALDIVERIDKVTEAGGPERFPPTRRLLLALFALFHDLRQQQSGAAVGGVGANERASADEADLILARAFGELADRAPGAALLAKMQRHMRLMIYGTTFNFVPRTETAAQLFTGEQVEVTVPTGALAPLIVSQLREAGQAEEELVEDILVAADVDTANVSDDFFAFAEQGVNLCREIEKRKGNLRCDPDAVYGFMTGGQEYYFHVAQRYNAPLSQSVFGAAKEANGKRLKRLTCEIREAFGSAEDEGKTLRREAGEPAASGEDIFARYLERAHDLSRQPA